MSATIKHYYASGNTSQGFASLFDSSLQNLERLYILVGEPESEASNIIRTIGHDLANKGYEIWFLHCPSDNDALDGFIAPGIRLGIVNGQTPRDITHKLPAEAIHSIDLNQAMQAADPDTRQAIEQLNHEIAKAHQDAYAGFEEALHIHDDWEALYIGNMSFAAANELTNEYTQLLFGQHKQDKISRVDRRFLGAATPKGSNDFVPNLTEGLKRYLIKGRAGTGKSTFLKKLAATSIHRGFDVEIYHCGFDPSSLDMVIVRDLGFAIFDSTAPHEYFPDRDSDEIVDMYSRCIKPGTDELYEDQLRDFKERYSTQMKQSTQHLAIAKQLQDERRKLLLPLIDQQIIARIQSELEHNIQQWITSKVKD